MSCHALIDTRELYSSSAAARMCGASGPERASFMVMGSGGSPTGEIHVRVVWEVSLQILLVRILRRLPAA